MCFRFLLGSGEAANWPGATKTVSEWFPKSERGWAVALFDSGSSVGAAVAPFLVFGIYRAFGSWRPVFILTALLGLVWVLVWKAFYQPPETHPNLGWQRRIPRAGTIPAALCQCRWIQCSCKCQPAGTSATEAGKSVPLYVAASTGCRAFGASFRRSPGVSDENTLARRHDARHPERQ